jgi:hypothetical protein
MSTVRLSVGIKESVERELISYRFAEEAKTLVSDFATLALDVYHDVYPETDRVKMQRLPRGWLPKRGDVKVTFAGEMTQLPFRGRCHGEIARARGKDGCSTEAERLIPFSDYGGRCVKQYEATHDLAERFAALEQRWSQLEADIRAAQRAARAAMDSVTTVKRLIEVWPEVAPFVQHYENKPNTLPAVPRSDLNVALGLPKEIAA